MSLRTQLLAGLLVVGDSGGDEPSGIPDMGVLGTLELAAVWAANRDAAVSRPAPSWLLCCAVTGKKDVRFCSGLTVLRLLDIFGVRRCSGVRWEVCDLSLVACRVA